MNTQSSTNSKAKLTKDVADPEQRHLIVDAQIRNGIPLQLRAMREERGWTQTVVAEKLGTTQNTVSRLENPKTSKPTITTLKRIAEAYDVALIVKFAPFSEFIDSVGGMSPKSVAVPSYEKEKQAQELSENESNDREREAIVAGKLISISAGSVHLTSSRPTAALRMMSVAQGASAGAQMLAQEPMRMPPQIENITPSNRVERGI